MGEGCIVVFALGEQGAVLVIEVALRLADGGTVGHLDARGDLTVIVIVIERIIVHKYIVCPVFFHTHTQHTVFIGVVRIQRILLGGELIFKRKHLKIFHIGQLRYRQILLRSGRQQLLLVGGVFLADVGIRIEGGGTVLYKAHDPEHGAADQQNGCTDQHRKQPRFFARLFHGRIFPGLFLLVSLFLF